MKTLFICHVERQFESFLSKTYLNSIRSLAARGCYDKIIFLNSGIDDICRWDALDGIYGAEDWDWSWGYEREMFDEDSEEQSFVINSSGHEFTWVPPELRGKTQKDFGEVSLIGGSAYECLKDFEEVLDYVGIKYKKLDGLVYGK